MEYGFQLCGKISIWMYLCLCAYYNVSYSNSSALRTLIILMAKVFIFDERPINCFGANVDSRGCVQMLTKFDNEEYGAGVLCNCQQQPTVDCRQFNTTDLVLVDSLYI